MKELNIRNTDNFSFEQGVKIETPRLRKGENYSKRVKYEEILVFRK